VLFEAGLAFGHHPERTILVEVGYTRPFSDVTGRHIVRLHNAPGSRISFVNRLKIAGCAINEYAEDWLDVGNFAADYVTATKRSRSERVMYGPSADAEGNEEKDSPANRMKYRAIAYLVLKYMVKRLEDLNPFLRLGVHPDEWFFISNTKTITLVVKKLNDEQMIEVEVEVKPNWRKGSSSWYAASLVDELIHKLQNNQYRLRRTTLLGPGGKGY
jgi:hypothetical protein